MEFRTRHLGLMAAGLIAMFSGPVHAQVSVTTYHNDNARTGQNTQETALTPANVNSSQFGKLFTVSVDGAVFAQPLYLANVNIAGATHNVIYVATQHDSVYAIDADTGTLYWQVSLIPTGGSTVSSNLDLSFCGDIQTEVGITGTPVIDPTTGTLYVVAKSKLNGAILQYLHALNVSTAAEKFAGPVAIQASVPGTASDGNGSMVAFDPRQENQRPALLLENGHVIVSWAAHCDRAPYHGWVMSYGASTLTQEAVYNTSPNGSANGIWMSGAGPAADTSGNIYFSTGNGTWSATDNGDSIVKLGPPSGSTLPLLDYFTPFNQASLSAADLDVSAGGLVLLPTLANGKQLLAMLSKAGTIYLVDRGNMGKYCVVMTPACTNSDTNIVQEIPGAFTGFWGAPAYWNGTVYWSGGNDTTGAAEPLKAYAFNASTGLFSTTPSSVAAHSFNFSGPVPSISSNGTANGIVWGMDNGSFASTCSGGTNCQVLYAYDATNLANMLYNSGQAANNRDVPGSAVKFTTPTIANGKVYVAGKGAVSAFGLLNAASPTATAPTFSPAGGTYASAQTVTLADTTPGAVIYYTTNGTAPTTASAKYSAALAISATTTVQALAVASGYVNSPVTSATYTISAVPTAAAPTFSPAAGTYTSTQTVSLSDSTAGAAIYYTTNGTTPTTASAKYSAALTISATTTVKALAVAAGYANSAVSSATYTISASPTTAAPAFSLAAGTYTSTQTVSLSDSTAGAAIYYTINGTTPTTASAKYSGALTISATTTVNALAVAAGYANSAVSSATYTISAGTSGSTPVSLTAAATVYPIGTNGVVVTNGGLDTWGFAFSSNLLASTVTWSGLTFNLGAPGAATAASNTAIALPAVKSSTLYLLAVAVNGSHTNRFVVTYTDGTTATFTQSLSDWVSPQNYAGESIAVTTAYRINQYGVIDNRPVSLYGYSFAIDSTRTVKSLTLPATRNIVVLAATLATAVSTPTAAAPTFSPAAGTYTSAQTVTLSDSTAGAAIFYTTNGTTPTSASAKYSAPLSISATTTVKALAMATGYTNSAIGSAAYTISAASSNGSTPVSLAAVFNVYAIGTNGSPVINGGLDTWGFAFSSNLLGTTVAWSSATFNLGVPNTLSGVSSTTIALPAAKSSTLRLLAAGVNGNQPNQTLVVTYTDGTNTTLTQSVSDWYAAQNYAGESIAVSMAYRINQYGAIDNNPVSLYGYSFAIDSTKTVKSLTLPANTSLIVLAADI